MPAKAESAFLLYSLDRLKNSQASTPSAIPLLYQRQKQLDVLPSLALLQRIAEKIGRMVSGHHGNTFKLIHLIP